MNNIPHNGILLAVFRLEKRIAVALLALWLPVTMHCVLEALPFFSFLQCCCQTDPSPTGPSDCADSGCAALESGLVKVEDEDAGLATPVLILAEFIVTEIHSDDSQGIDRPVPESGPPPELAMAWQFSYRTALSPRAPSLLA